jgi:hypothetical protein
LSNTNPYKTGMNSDTPEVFQRRTDNTVAKRKGTKRLSWPEQANVQCDDGAVGFVLDQKA